MVRLPSLVLIGWLVTAEARPGLILADHDAVAGRASRGYAGRGGAEVIVQSEAAAELGWGCQHEAGRRHLAWPAENDAQRHGAVSA